MFIHVRSALFTFTYNVTGAMYGTLSLLLLFLPLRVRHKIIISWTRLAVFLVRVLCGVRYKVTGLENVPKRGEPVIIMSKHQSTWETLFLQYAFWPASTVLKKELLRIPFFGWGLAALRPIAIDRSNPRKALRKVKERGLQRLASGYNLLLFPEGTRIPQGQKGKYARSGAEISIASGTPIIPVALNAGRFWPPKDLKKYPGCISVVIGEPILPGDKTSKHLIEEVENWIETQMQNL